MPHFLAMMVRAPRAVVSGGEFDGPADRPPFAPLARLTSTIDTGWADRLSHEQTDNAEFATRSTARGARTIIGRKWGALLSTGGRRSTFAPGGRSEAD